MTMTPPQSLIDLLANIETWREGERKNPDYFKYPNPANNDLNREVIEPDSNAIGPAYINKKGAVILRMDDDFTVAAILPYEAVYYDLETIAALLWPGEKFTFWPDHDSEAADKLQKLAQQNRQFGDALFKGHSMVPVTVLDKGAESNGLCTLTLRNELDSGVYKAKMWHHQVVDIEPGPAIVIGDIGNNGFMDIDCFYKAHGNLTFTDAAGCTFPWKF